MRSGLNMPNIKVASLKTATDQDCALSMLPRRGVVSFIVKKVIKPLVEHVEKFIFTQTFQTWNLLKVRHFLYLSRLDGHLDMAGGG